MLNTEKELPQNALLLFVKTKIIRPAKLDFSPQRFGVSCWRSGMSAV